MNLSRIKKTFPALLMTACSILIAPEVKAQAGVNDNDCVFLFNLLIDQANYERWSPKRLEQETAEYIDAAPRCREIFLEGLRNA